MQPGRKRKSKQSKELKASGAQTPSAEGVETLWRAPHGQKSEPDNNQRCLDICVLSTDVFLGVQDIYGLQLRLDLISISTPICTVRLRPPFREELAFSAPRTFAPNSITFRGNHEQTAENQKHRLHTNLIAYPRRDFAHFDSDLANRRHSRGGFIIVDCHLRNPLILRPRTKWLWPLAKTRSLTHATAVEQTDQTPLNPNIGSLALQTLNRLESTPRYNSG